MHYFPLIYFSNKHLHVSSRLAAHHQEVRLYWQDRDGKPSRSCQQPITHGYTCCCLYSVDPPDDEQQACSKHVEASYWNKLIVNSASYWFMLYSVRKCISGISVVEVTAIDVNYQNSVLKCQQCDRNEKTVCAAGRLLRLVVMLCERIFAAWWKE